MLEKAKRMNLPNLIFGKKKLLRERFFNIQSTVMFSSLNHEYKVIFAITVTQEMSLGNFAVNVVPTDLISNFASYHCNSYGFSALVAAAILNTN